MTNKKWLVIERTNYGENNDSFSISKIASFKFDYSKYKAVNRKGKRPG